MILACNCSSGPFGNKAAAIQQDAMYGVGSRVHTPMAKEDSYRCTVCLHERAKKNSSDDAKVKGKKSKKEEKPEKSDKKLAKR